VTANSPSLVNISFSTFVNDNSTVVTENVGPMMCKHWSRP
jgi:hypothetical protein